MALQADQLNLTDLGGFKLKISPPQLWEAEFKRLEAGEDKSGDENTTGNLGLTLGLNRTGLDAVTVQLEARSQESGFRFNVSYRALLQAIPTAEEDLEWDEVLRSVAVSIGPVLIYPYIRETLSSLSVRAGMDPLLLPVMNVGALFSTEDVVLPEFDHERDNDA